MINLCKDCVYFLYQGEEWGDTPKCGHPNLTEVEPVFGEIIHKSFTGSHCHNQRKPGWSCGPSGAWFEPKIPTPESTT